MTTEELNSSSLFQTKRDLISFFHAEAKKPRSFLCYKCASFVPVCTGICITATTHISQTTPDRKKKHSCTFFPLPLGNVHEVS